jgi:hypothetical protein
MIQKNLSRRQALKAILAATGGIGLSAFLPSEWLKPVVKTGVLPVHAQTSIVPDCSGFKTGFHYYTHDLYGYAWFELGGSGTLPTSYEIVGTPTLGGSLTSQVTGTTPGKIYASGTYSDDLVYYSPKTGATTISIKLKFIYPDSSACMGTFTDRSLDYVLHA